MYLSELRKKRVEESLYFHRINVVYDKCILKKVILREEG